MRILRISNHTHIGFRISQWDEGRQRALHDLMIQSDSHFDMNNTATMHSLHSPRSLKIVEIKDEGAKRPLFGLAFEYWGVSLAACR